MTWVPGFMLGFIVGVPVACVLPGLATSAQSADLHRELWQCQVAMSQLVQAVDEDVRTMDNHVLNTALNQAREVMER